MDKRLTALDWTLLQAFLAVADTGSLSAAAKALGTSQPTVGRQIRTLEADLDAELFQRQPRGLRLTETGEALLGPARRMRDAATEISLTAAGQGARLEGTVRITASVFTAQYFLPPVIAMLRAEEPRIQIELVATDETENLLFQEADIALRMYTPKQLDLVVKRLGAVALGLYAARSYLARRQVPEGLVDLGAHDLVGYDAEDRLIRGMRDRGMAATRETFATRCDLQSVYWELVREGCGIGVGQVDIAARDPNLVRILPDLRIDPLEVYIAAHERMRQVPRVRRVWDHLCAHLPALLS